MSTDSKHLVILAAGTGGHVMPGLAVAKVMASRGWKISWVGTVAGMERGLVERHGIPFHALDFQGVRGRGPLGAIKGGFKLIGAFFASMKLLNELKPDAVFSTGGYVAVPFGFAAHRRKLPLVMMNCDADLLMSTNTLLPFCDALACGFAGGARTFAKEKGRTTGNPCYEDQMEGVALFAPAGPHGEPHGAAARLHLRRQPRRPGLQRQHARRLCGHSAGAASDHRSSDGQGPRRARARGL